MAYKINSGQQEILDKIFKNILPNESFNSEVASQILSELDTFVNSDELYGIYYIFWKILHTIKLIKLYRRSYDMALTRETFEQAIMVSLNDTIVSEEFGAELYFADNGLSYDLSVPLQLEQATDFAYTALLDKYDEIMELEVTPEESLALVEVFKDDLKQSIATMHVSLLAQCLTNGVKYDKKTYRGYDDWLKLSQKLQSEISVRFKSNTIEKRHKAYTIKSYSDSLDFDNENADSIRPLFYMGFEPIDNLTPIKTQDIITIVADEGTGKTMLTIYLCYRALMAGNNVLICCGETASLKIKRGIESLHIWKMFGKQFTYGEISNPSVLFDSSDGVDAVKTEELIQMIKAGQIDLYENESHGRISFIQDLTYEKVEKQLIEIHEEIKFDIVAIDHVGALDKDGSYVFGERLTDRNKRITHLFESEDRLVKELNIAFINTSHTDRDTATANVRGREVGVRIAADSSSVSKYSSMIFLLTQNEDARRNSQVILQLKKTRDTDPYTYPMVINRMGITKDHYYDPEMQGSFGEDNVDIEDLIE